MGCASCGSSSLTSSTSSKIVTGSVTYDGIDFTCLTNPDLDTIKTDGLNTVLLRLFDAACGDGGCCISTVTYSELVTHITDGTLIPGSIYRFPYATKHLMSGTAGAYNDTTVNYDDGTAVKAAFTPDTEYLLVNALSATEIHVEVYSESFPRDIIYYDYSSDKTEDGLLDRPGFITYREDPDNDVSTHFDFRNVLHRRFDMDIYTSTNRSAEFETALNYGGTAPTDDDFNHEIFYGMASPTQIGPIPAFANFDNSGNSDIGLISTANTTGYRDFKTFVGYGEILFKSPVAEAPRFRNIHIKKSNALARVVGSASGAGITLSNAGTVGSPYPFFANVVFFCRSAENVSIGQNATGITFTGRAIREINIGHNNENIIIGGAQSAPIYTVATEPTFAGYNENIEIGNDNRNVFVSTASRRITLGNSNIGFMTNRFCFDISVGSYNTNTYFSYSFDNEVEDWCTGVRLSSSSNSTIEAQNVNIDLIKSQSGTVETRSSFPTKITGVSGSVTDGFGITLTDTSASNNRIVVGATSNNIFAVSCWGLEMGSNCKNIYAVKAGNTKIGSSCQEIDLDYTKQLTIGDNSTKLEIASTIGTSLGKGCAEVKILQTNYVNIGDSAYQVIVSNSGTDVTIGNYCTQLALTYPIRVAIGNYANNITIRAGVDVYIGDNAVDMFFESPNRCTVGDRCRKITVNTVGLRFKPSFLATDLSIYNYWVDNTNRNLTGRTWIDPADNTSPITAVEYTTSLATYISAAGSVPSENFIGNNCEEIMIISSSQNTIGDNCFLISIGEDTTSSTNYSLTFTAGIADPAGSTPAYTIPNVTALAVLGGLDCDDNIIGHNCRDLRIRGNGQSGNEFGNIVTDVEAVPGFAFTNNKVLVDGNNVTLTAAYDKKIYDKASPDTERWETGIDNTGAVTASTKLA